MNCSVNRDVYRKESSFHVSGLTRFKHKVEKVMDICDLLKLRRSVEELGRVESSLCSWLSSCAPRRSGITYAEAATLFRVLYEVMEDELRNTKFIRILSDKSELLDNPALFGEKFIVAFPQATEELKEAGNCLAIGLYTAAVFHLMRVVELGLRNLAVQLKAKTIMRKLKQKKIPVELATWEEIITTLETKLHQLRNMQRSARREKKIESCAELLKEFRSIKDLWRNKAMHTRAVYDEDQAQSAFNHVRNFMQKLAEGI